MDPLVCAQSRSAQGRPLDRRNARARFISAYVVLGEERQEMLTIHCGRHSCASHLLAAGWPIPVVRDMMGHANMWTTNLYSHVVVDDDVPPDPFAFAGGGSGTAFLAESGGDLHGGTGAYGLRSCCWPAGERRISCGRPG